MSKVSIKAFARQIGIYPEQLIRQLEKSGISNKEPSSYLNDVEKRHLLSYLRSGNTGSDQQETDRLDPIKPPLPLDADEIISPAFVGQGQLLEIREQDAVYELEVAKRRIESLKEELERARGELESAQNKIYETEADVKEQKEAPEGAVHRPKVFISYSYDSKEHKGWVKEFATDLVSNGVETMLDQWTLHPGDPLTKFMEQGIAQADFVLIICTKNYKMKSDARLGGVGYEESIISSELFESSNHRKYVPLLRSGGKQEAMPVHLSSKVFIDFSDDESREESLVDLLLTLYGRRPEPPPLGDVPDL